MAANFGERAGSCKRDGEGKRGNTQTTQNTNITNKTNRTKQNTKHRKQQNSKQNEEIHKTTQNETKQITAMAANFGERASGSAEGRRGGFYIKDQIKKKKEK